MRRKFIIKLVISFILAVSVGIGIDAYFSNINYITKEEIATIETNILTDDNTDAAIVNEETEVTNDLEIETIITNVAKEETTVNKTNEQTINNTNSQTKEKITSKSKSETKENTNSKSISTKTEVVSSPKVTTEQPKKEETTQKEIVLTPIPTPTPPTETSKKQDALKCEGNKHFMEVGNSNKWFNTETEAIAYYKSIIKKWGDKLESFNDYNSEEFKIFNAEYDKNCPYRL